MNKINIYVLTFFLSLAGVSIYAQNNRSQVVITSGQDNNVSVSYTHLTLPTNSLV